MKALRLVLCLWITFTCISSLAQDTAAAAAAALSKGDYATAITAYKKIVAASPNDAASWEQLGVAMLQAGRYPESIEPLQKALDNGLKTPLIGKYNLACAYARTGDKTHALDLLEEVVKKGLGVQIAGDPDLASLKDEPRFQEMAKQVQAGAHPCEDAQAHPEFRQLDFWVGTWDVYAGKTKVGESHVDQILSDCVVFENWRANGGTEGKSFNKYNVALHKWEQFWVADNGTTTRYVGELQDGEMRYMADKNAMPTGAPLIRLTFVPLPGGRVRQHSETSNDGGKTWIVAYDFTYVKKS